MRIAFDGTSIRPRRTGVGYYSEHLLHHLAAQDDEVAVISNRPLELDSPLPSGVRVVTTPRRVPRMVWMQTHAASAIKSVGADVAHFTNGMMPLVSPVPTVVTIHDVSLRLYPHYHPPRRVLLNGPLVTIAAHRADAIITVSESAKRDIVSLYKIDPGRVHVVYEAAGATFRRVCDPETLDRIRKTYGLADRVILYVGTIEPRKNLPKLVEAFTARRHAGELSHQLVCVGPYGWKSRGLDELIARLGASDAVRFTGYVPFADLAALYSLAELFVYPSMYEGFGLPVVEAMACGAPVVTGRTAALAEVGGAAVEQVDRLDASSLGDALVALANDPAKRAHMSAAGLRRAHEFSWDRAAKESLEIYRSVAVRKRATRVSRPPVATVASSTAAADVLFGQAYFLRFDPKLWEARQPYAPLGALYAAAYVRDSGYSVALFDAMLADSVDEWSAALDRHRPRFAVIYEDNFNYLTKMCLLRMREAALLMVDAARARGITAIVAGSDASDHPDTYLDRGADVVLSGEGERTLVELLDVLIGRRAGGLEDVDGLCLRSESGRLVKTRPRDVIRDLDSLPFPAWDLVDVDRYKKVWRSRHGYYSMNVVTTRGCPYHCNWCAKPIYGQRYSARSPRHVVDEIVWLHETYRPDHLWIADDIFGLQPGWITQFATLLDARGVHIPFKCLLRADQVTADVAASLRSARCRTAWIGAESGSQRVLDAMEKGTRVEQIAAATRHLHDAGIEVGFFLQFGYPGETIDDIEQTLHMVRTCRPDDIGVSVSYPLPGTPFYERVKTQLGEKRNWLDSDDLAMMYCATYDPAFYRALYAQVHAEFRLRRSARNVASAALRPWTVRGRHVRDLAHIGYYAAALPLLQWRASRSTRVSAARAPRLAPLVSPQAAAVPTDQASLE